MSRLTVEKGDTKRTARRRGASGVGDRLQSLFTVRRVAVMLLLLIVTMALIVRAPRFFAPANLENVARQAAILGVVTLGQTIVMLARGIDLSVGATMAVAMTILAEVGVAGGSWVTAVGIALAIGIGIGAINSLLVVGRGVPPFVATLAMLFLISGARLWATGGILAGTVPREVRFLGGGYIGPIRTPVVIFLVLAFATQVVLRGTTFGRRIYAVGDNPAAARLSGIRVGWIVSATFLISGALAILAGLMLAGYVAHVDQYVGQGYELDSVAAALIGGTSFFGGKGNAIGAVVGALVIASLLNVLILLNVGAPAQLIIKGMIIVAAVAVQRRGMRG
jgi:ribose/xylose/arabinose/galactoside ABC-type transport system permease subunit